MEEIKIHKSVNLINPALVAGWPGMGSVALGAVDYMRRKLNATKFAEIKIDPITTLDSMMVESGFAFMPPPPHNVFYYIKDPDMIIFEGEAQLPGRDGIRLLNMVLDLAVRFKAARIYTTAAFPAPVSYHDTPEVYGAVNKKLLGGILKKFNIKPMSGGHISGLNGLMLGFARERNIDAMCLLATMPQYAIGLPNPKASLAVIEALRKILKFEIDLAGLEGYAKAMGDKMSAIEDKVKDVLVIDNNLMDHYKEDKEPFTQDKHVPNYIIEKIEKLFHETLQDRTKAAVLKKELDRWDLYRMYEDRFLDIFKKGQ